MDENLHADAGIRTHSHWPHLKLSTGTVAGGADIHTQMASASRLK
jgi:hypothetical protein